MEALPLTVGELIATLDRETTVKNPTVKDTIIDIQRRAGARELVDKLLFLLKRQKEEDIHNRRVI